MEIQKQSMHKIVGVVSSSVESESQLLRRESEILGLPYFCPNDINDGRFLEEISQLAPDLNVNVNLNHIFRDELIGLPLHDTINLHAGLCPNYRGGGSIYGAIINGETEFGLTVHFMDAGIDSGPIIIQEKVPIGANDNMAVLHERMEKIAPTIIRKALNQIDNGDFIARKQAHIYGSYFPKKPDGDEIINWSESSQLIYDRIRARNPGPLNKTYLGRNEIIIKTASLTDYPIFTGTCGQVLAVIKDRGVVVKTGDSAILIEEFAYGGNPKEFFRAEFRIGTTFLSNWRKAYLDLALQQDILTSRVKNIESMIGSLRKGK